MDAPVFSSGEDLGRSRGTDFYAIHDGLTQVERELRGRVRAYCDDEPARGDGSFARLHGVHSGPAMGTISLLGSEEHKQRWIGNGTVADVVVVCARDGDGKVGAVVVDHVGGADNPVPGYRPRAITGISAAADGSGISPDASASRPGEEARR